MSKQALIENGVVTNIIVATIEQVLDIPGLWVDVTGMDEVVIGSTYANAIFTPPVIAPLPNRKVLSGSEWVDTWTDVEWKALKTFRNNGTSNGDKLDQMMESIRWTNAVDLESTKMVQFYSWLVARNSITQNRADELQAGIPQT